MNGINVKRDGVSPMKALVVGELLMDELPGARRPGGAPFNVAQHLQRLGHEVRFVSAVGADETGQQLRAAVERTGLNPAWVQVDLKHPTGQVQVELDSHGVPSYTILENRAYDHVDWAGCAPTDPPADLVYFGSLVQRTERGRERMQRLLREISHRTVRLYDVNFREGCDREEIVLPSLEQTDVLKLNDEELERIARMTGMDGTADERAEWILEKFDLHCIAVTHGAQGSTMYRGGQRIHQPAGKLRPEQIVDTVGAGDAFAAVLADGLHAGHPAEVVLQRATRMAEFICTQSGAVPEEETMYQTLKQEG